MADATDYSGLNTLDKIEHKNWKARLEGYEESLKDMQKADNGKDPIFNPYLGLVKNMVIDSNAVAQEKALEVILLFVQEANIATKAANDICPGIVNKCFNSSRQKTKDIGFEILKVLIEIEKQDVVMEELMKGLSCKTPKVVVGSTVVLKDCLHDFGPKIVPMKELFKTVPKLLEDRDKNVRESGKEMIIEMYRWLGNSTMSSVLSQLKPVQVTELTAEFEKLPQGEKPVPSRYLRSQKPKDGGAAAAVKPSGTGDGAVREGPARVTAVDIDPYDLIDPVEVINKIPGNFYEQIEEKKWTDRKEALEAIDKLTNHEKLVPGEYGELVKALLKVLSKDSNIVLVALAGKILHQIAKGLRKKYSPYALNTIQVCLEKFKERKAAVVKSLRDTIDASFASISMDSCLPLLTAALDHKTPSVRSETALFLARMFEWSPPVILTTKLLKQLIPGLTKLCLDNVMEVREVAFQSLGTAMKVVTEKKMRPFLEEMDTMKVARIKEFYEKAQLEPTNGAQLGRTVSQTANAIVAHVNTATIAVALPLHVVDIEPHTDLSPIGIREKRKRNKSPIFRKTAREKQSKVEINNDNNLSFTDDLINTPDCDEYIRKSPEKISITNDYLPRENPKKRTEKCLANFKTHQEDISKRAISQDNKLYDPKHSEFNRAIEISKVPDQDLLDNYTWLLNFNHKQQNSNREYLINNQVKRIIDSIHNDDIADSSYTFNCLHELMKEEPLILLDYGPLLLAAVCQQMWLIASKLTSGQIDVVFTVDNINHCLFHLKQVVEIENIFDKFDDESIVIVMALLLHVTQQLHTVSDTGIFTGYLAALGTEIYRKCLHRPLSNILKVMAIQMKSSNLLEVDIFKGKNIAGNIESVYGKYLKLPMEDFGGRNGSDIPQIDLTHCQPFISQIANCK